MKILMATAEMAPLVRTGGLGDVLEALPAALRARGHEVAVALPLYPQVRAYLPVEATGVSLPVVLGGGQRLDVQVYEGVAPNGVPLFLLGCDRFFDRPGLYGPDAGSAYEDNAARFTWFCRAVTELARHLDPSPEVLHLHDWPTALVPAMVREAGLPFATVYTIHNLAHQGAFPPESFGLAGLPWAYYNAEGVEAWGAFNFMKAGIAFADAITTVSEPYAREICTPEGGCGLDGILRARAGRLRGILNGVDTTRWSPAHDAALPARYSAEDLSGKALCRSALLEELGLLPEARGPVFALVGRLVEQKGLAWLTPLLDRLLADDVRLAILGEGEARWERELLVAARRHPGKFAFRQGFDEALSHRLMAGADVFLAPSRYEPCGLTAMYAQLYGTVPVAHATGGLHQIIRDDDPATPGTGFLFFEETPEAFWDALARARAAFEDAAHWAALRARAMEADFSWSTAAARYEQVYASAAKHER